MSSDIAAWVGAGTGTMALIWQAATWRRSKHDVKVNVSNAFPVYGSSLGDHWVKVEAVNTGSDAVTITGWGVGMGQGGSAVSVDQLPESTRLPHRLEGGGNAPFYMPAVDLRRQHHERHVAYRHMRAWVRLGTGKTVKSRRGLPLAD